MSHSSLLIFSRDEQSEFESTENNNLDKYNFLYKGMQTQLDSLRHQRYAMFIFRPAYPELCILINSYTD